MLQLCASAIALRARHETPVWCNASGYLATAFSDDPATTIVDPRNAGATSTDRGRYTDSGVEWSSLDLSVETTEVYADSRLVCWCAPVRLWVDTGAGYLSWPSAARRDIGCAAI